MSADFEIIGKENVEIADLPKKDEPCVKFSTVEKQKIKYFPIGCIGKTVTGYEPLPPFTKQHCWWDKHAFKTTPLGCPLVYHYKPNAIETSRVIEKLKAMNIDFSTTDFFETEGIFCDFSCIKAYILDELQKDKSSKYKDSLGLLTQLATILYPDIEQEILPAPSWKLLKTFGGPLTIEQFRTNSRSVVYEQTTNVKRPYMFASTFYVKEKKIRSK